MGDGAVTAWEELNIANDFLFGKMQNPENPGLYKELLQRILPDLKIDCYLII